MRHNVAGPMAGVTTGPTDDLLPPRASRALFWRPRLLEDAPFAAHLPFAFWLVETCRPRRVVELGLGAGVSYFAFCQAVDKLGLESRCVAVDHWGGDRFSPPDPEAGAAAARHNAQLYQEFSSLVTADLIGAESRFADGAIDLLHVDVEPTAAVVDGLLHAWARKLSPRAVALLHGTRTRYAAPEAAAFLAGIRARHRTVELDAGEGLTVALIGSEQPEKLLRLAALEPGSAEQGAALAVFHRLGRGHAFEARARTDAARLDALGAAVAQAEAALADARAEAAARDAELARQRATLTETTQASRRDAARAERLEADLRAARDACAAAEARVAERFAELATLTGLIETERKAAAEAAAAREATAARIARLETELRDAQAEQERAQAAAAAQARNAQERAAAAERERAQAEAAAAKTAEAATLAAAAAEAAAAAAVVEAAATEAARAAAQTSLAAEQAARRKLEAELVKIRTYGRTLEAKHRDMLQSETWRVMEPARRAMRLLTGKRAPQPFVPRLIDGAGAAGKPTGATGGSPGGSSGSKPSGGRSAAKPARKPAPDLAALTAEEARATAAQLIGLAGKRDYPGLMARERRFADGGGSDQAFFLRRFSRLLALKRLSAFTEAAALVDEVDARLGGGKRDWLVAFFGPDAYARYVIDATTALTRVGRHADARRLADDAVDRLDAPPALLAHRAEMSWPYMADAARADLAAAAARAPLDGGHMLLQAYLDHLAGAAPAAPGAAGRAGHPQLALVAAASGLAHGDFAAYRAELNGYFEAQGLRPPLAPDATRFAFEDLSGAAAPTPPGAAAPTPPGAAGDGPLVSVVMTTFDSADTVGYALGSIQAQTHAALEILVVDDGSTDGTRDRLAALAATDPRIRVLLNDENMGTYCAKNRAIAEAAGVYVTLHDSDDWAHPERIARHVAMMESAPALAASRSEWLRVEPDGALHFRRWGAKFQHPNPASTFLRRTAVGKVGYFDSVRYGADSEYWFRLNRVFPGQVKSLPLCLGLGAIRPTSLTQSGSGAMELENYAPVRGAYAAAYLDWHAATDVARLRMPARLRARPFPAPAEMAVPPPAAPAAAAGGAPEFMFGISLVSRQVSTDWARTEELLGHTLRSLLNQSDPRFTVAICGHERPALRELDDPRVLFVESDQGPPKNPSGFRGDKMRKRRIVGSILRERGGGYFFPLDADDLVHRDVVAHVLGDDNRRGYLIEKGYALDYNNHRLAPIPGAWSVSFDRSCGSSAVMFFEPDDLPAGSDPDPDLYFNLFQSHAYWPLVAEENGRRLDPLPFPGGVYVVNHAQNLSFRLQRKGVRTENILRAIEDHRVADTDAVVRDQFGWTP